MDTTQNIFVTHGPGQVIISQVGRLQAEFSPVPGQNSQQGVLFWFSHRALARPRLPANRTHRFTAFSNYLHFKNMHKTPSNDNLASEVEEIV